MSRDQRVNDSCLEAASVPPTDSGKPSGYFPDTQWTTLLKPLARRSPTEIETLDRLFRIYRPAILGFIRPRVRDPQLAEDLTHDYIHRLLKSDDLLRMDRSKGKFRSFLIVSIKHFLANHFEAIATLKRGGGVVHVPVEEHADEISEDPKDHDIFMQEWVNAINNEVMERLRGEWAAVGKSNELEDYEPFIWEKKGTESRADLAKKHGLTANAVNVRVSRLRDRYKTLLREVVGQTVREGEVDEEIRMLTARILSPESEKRR
jgi:RNA polymerase sigma factor (sigma-70 family)